MIQNFHTIICLLQHHFLKHSLQKKYLVFTDSAGRQNLYLKDTNPYWDLGVYQQKQKNLQRHGWMGKCCWHCWQKNFSAMLIFPPLGRQEKNRSIWRETRLVFLLILMVIMPRNSLPFGQDFLHFSVSSFVEKRKKGRLQMASFSLSQCI